MPVKTFWMMHKNIDRLMAEADLRMLSVIAYGQSGEGVETFSKDMRKQMGQVAIIDEAKVAMTEDVDSEGLESLKAMGRIR
jgi:hypothetical protein